MVLIQKIAEMLIVCIKHMCSGRHGGATIPLVFMHMPFLEDTQPSRNA